MISLIAFVLVIPSKLPGPAIAHQNDGATTYIFVSASEQILGTLAFILFCIGAMLSSGLFEIGYGDRPDTQVMAGAALLSAAAGIALGFLLAELVEGPLGRFRAVSVSGDDVALIRMMDKTVLKRSDIAQVTEKKVRSRRSSHVCLEIKEQGGKLYRSVPLRSRFGRPQGYRETLDALQSELGDIAPGSLPPS